MLQVRSGIRFKDLEVFLILVGAHLITLVGSAMTRFALGVYVYEQTGQVQDFASILIAGFVPGILLSPVAGVWVDRSGPRLMVLAGDLLGGVTVVSLLVVALTGGVGTAHVLMVSAILSCVSALQGPALHTLIPFLIPTSYVTRANGVFSTVTALSDVIAPMLAGVMLTAGSLSMVLGFDLMTYGIAIAGTLSIWGRLNVQKKEPGGAPEGQQAAGSFWRELREGARHLLQRKPLLYLVLLFTFMNLAMGFNSALGQPYVLSMGTKEQLGVLNSLFGAGMVLGGLLMSTLKMQSGRLRMVLMGNLGLGVAIALTGFGRHPWVIGVAWVAIGLLLPMVNATVVSILQMRTAPGYLGRVMSFARMLAWMSMPVGQLLAGQLADRLMRAGVPAQSGSWLSLLFAPGKSASYGMLLACTGLFVIGIVSVFSFFKPLYQLEGETVHEA